MNAFSNFKRSGLFLVLLAALLLLTAVGIQAQEAMQVGVELVAEGLTAPVALVSAHDGTGRLFIVDQAGTIRILSADGQLVERPFLDLTGQIIPLQADY